MGKNKPLTVHNCTTVISGTACNHLRWVPAGGKGVGESQLTEDEKYWNQGVGLLLTTLENRTRKNPTLLSNAHLQRQCKTQGLSMTALQYFARTNVKILEFFWLLNVNANRIHIFPGLLMWKTGHYVRQWKWCWKEGVGENQLLKISTMLSIVPCFHDKNCPITQLSLLTENQDASITWSGE